MRTIRGSADLHIGYLIIAQTIRAELGHERVICSWRFKNFHTYYQRITGLHDNNMTLCFPGTSSLWELLVKQPHNKQRTPAMRTRAHPASVDSKADTQRRAVMNATSRLLPRYGLQGITFRMIAKEVGLSVGAIQHYFESHEDILYQTCRWGMHERLRPWNDVAQRYADPWQRIQALLKYFFSDDHFRSRAIWWLEFCAAASRDPRLGTETPKLYAEWGNSLRRAIEDGVAEKMFRLTTPVDNVVSTILLMISGAEVASSINASRMTCRHMRNLLTEYIEAALNVKR